MTEHTKGPWAFDGAATDEVYQDCGAMITICTVAMHGEGAANARLLAAAPDIWAALVEAQRFMDYFANGRHEFSGPGTPKSCLAMIDGALAKVAAP